MTVSEISWTIIVAEGSPGESFRLAARASGLCIRFAHMRNNSVLGYGIASCYSIGTTLVLLRRGELLKASGPSLRWMEAVGGGIEDTLAPTDAVRAALAAVAKGQSQVIRLNQ